MLSTWHCQQRSGGTVDRLMLTRGCSGGETTPIYSVIISSPPLFVALCLTEPCYKEASLDACGRYVVYKT
jgi:hypothetical protein